MLQNFHFLRPEWLLLLPVIALFLYFLLKNQKQQSAWESVCDPALLKFQLAQQSQNSSKPSKILHWIIPFVLFLTIFAIAGPSWEKKEQPIFQQGNALIIILDLSLSMNAEDIKPSRLERAKLKLIDILQQKKEGQTALIAYAGDAHTVSPLTIDNKTIMSLLPSLDSTIMPRAGSHIDDALLIAKQLFINAGFTQGDILLLTDGIDSTEEKKSAKTVKTLYRQGYRLSIIGVGSLQGSPIPFPGQGGFIKDQTGQVILSKLSPAPLKKLSDLGGGTYHPLSLNDSDFKSLLDKRVTNNKMIKEQDNQLEQWVDAGGYLTLFIIPIALLAFRRGLLSLIFILFLLPLSYKEPAFAEPVITEDSNTTQFLSEPLKASIKKQWNNLWSTANQQGQKAFNNNDYSTAAESFNNKDWKASAHYRAGNFEQALEEFKQLDDTNSLYNKGNALANLQKFPEAIEAYEEALKREPKHQDALSNRDYLKELLAQQEQQKSDQQQENADSTSDEQQQKDDSESSSKSEKKSDSESDSGKENQQQSEEGQEDQDSDSNPGDKDSDSTSKPNKPQENKSDNNASQDQAQPDQPQEAHEPESASEKAMQEAQKAQESDQNQTEEETGSENHKEMPAEDVLSQLTQEEQQSLKQWLRQIPDNPGELLRIKFRNNSLLKERQPESKAQYEGNPW